MKNIIFIFFLLITFESTHSQNSRWIYFTHTDQDNIDFYYDSETIKYENSYVELWIKRIENDDQKIEKILDNIKLFCYSDKVFYINSIVYYRNGMNESVNLNLPETIIPETPLETLSKIICKNK